jgi:hypothetical protein
MRLGADGRRAPGTGGLTHFESADCMHVRSSGWRARGIGGWDAGRTGGGRPLRKNADGILPRFGSCAFSAGSRRLVPRRRGMRASDVFSCAGPNQRLMKAVMAENDSHPALQSVSSLAGGIGGSGSTSERAPRRGRRVVRIPSAARQPRRRRRWAGLARRFGPSTPAARPLWRILRRPCLRSKLAHPSPPGTRWGTCRLRGGGMRLTRI